MVYVIADLVTQIVPQQNLSFLYINQESVIKEYQNFKFQQPYKQALYHCSLLLEDQTWPWSDKLEVLPHLEANHLAQFSAIMLEKTFLEFYIAG